VRVDEIIKMVLENLPALDALDSSRFVDDPFLRYDALFACVNELHTNTVYRALRHILDELSDD
jgi:hypothetical protein